MLAKILQRRLAALEAIQSAPDDQPTEIWLCAPGDEDHAVLLWRAESCD